MSTAPRPIRVNRAPVLTLWESLVAELLVEHPERAGYVVMHKPPLGQHEAPGNLAGRIEQATRPDREE
jgi:hypothetical protein